MSGASTGPASSVRVSSAARPGLGDSASGCCQFTSRAGRPLLAPSLERCKTPPTTCREHCHRLRVNRSQSQAVPTEQVRGHRSAHLENENQGQLSDLSQATQVQVLSGMPRTHSGRTKSQSFLLSPLI